MLTALRDGRVVRLRPIRPSDKALLADGLAHLSPRSVHQRFLAPKPRFTGAELRYLTEVDGRDHVALVAVDPQDTGRLLGVGRFVRLPEDPASAEVAVTIADDVQGLGLGTVLGLALADRARALGIRRFTATTLGTNVAAHRLMRRISTRLEERHAGVVDELVAELAA